MQKNLFFIICFFAASNLFAPSLQKQTSQLASTQEVVTKNLKLITAKITELVDQIKEKEKIFDMNQRQIAIISRPPKTIVVAGRQSFNQLKEKEADLIKKKEMLLAELTKIKDEVDDYLNLQNHSIKKLGTIHDNLVLEVRKEDLQQRDLAIFGSNN